MRAFVLDDLDSQPHLRDDLPDPEPGEGELVVRVRASSVNPVDNAIVGGLMQGMADYDFPVVLGRDYAGVVEGVGAGVDSYQAGDEIFGYLPAIHPDIHDGAWAELAPVAGDSIFTRKPSGVDFATAGAAPVVALTAMAAIDALEIKEGDTVLIVGASGGVGTFAVQLAKRAGAHVIAPGFPEDESYLVDLGVDHVIPRDGDIAAAARELEDDGVDALIDTVSRSQDEFEVNAAALSDGGRAASPVAAAGDGPGRHNISGGSDPSAIETLAELLDEGALMVSIQRTYRLEDAGEALGDLTAKHTAGKLGVAVAD